MTKRILVLLPCLLLAAAAARADTVRTITESYPARGLEELSIDVGVGEVDVQGTDGNSVEVEISLECGFTDGRGCRDWAQGAELRSEESGGTLSLRLGSSRDGDDDQPGLEVRLRLPRHLGLDLDLGVGDVDISGLEGDLRLEVGVGDVDVSVPASAVGSVHLSAGVGEVDLAGSGVRAEGEGMVGESLRWREGSGDATVEIECGVGDVDVRLR